MRAAVASKRGRNKNRQHAFRRRKDYPRAVQAGMHRCPACGKWCYRTRADAESTVGKLHPGATVHYYTCSDTGFWHFTSMTAEQMARIRARRAFEETGDEYPGDAYPEEEEAV